MKTSGNTILITGGTSGIGFELAARLVALGNTIVMTGRNESRLDAVGKMLPSVHPIQSDVSDPAAIAKLHRQVVVAFCRS